MNVFTYKVGDVGSVVFNSGLFNFFSEILHFQLQVFPAF